VAADHVVVSEALIEAGERGFFELCPVAAYKMDSVYLAQRLCGY
jgi:hypothetical protein